MVNKIGIWIKKRLKTEKDVLYNWKKYTNNLKQHLIPYALSIDNTQYHWYLYHDTSQISLKFKETIIKLTNIAYFDSLPISQVTEAEFTRHILTEYLFVTMTNIVTWAYCVIKEVWYYLVHKYSIKIHLIHSDYYTEREHFMIAVKQNKAWYKLTISK